MFKKSQANFSVPSKSSTTNSPSKIRVPLSNSPLINNISNGISGNTNGNTASSRTLLIIFPTLEEFELEREILCNNVLPELQQFCSERDMELESCTFFETKDFIKNIDEILILRQLLDEENTIALCFVGDKYGEVMLPLELRKNEFEEILALALETSNEAELLKEFYVLEKDRSENHFDTYRLKPSQATRDPASAKRLCKALQKCLEKAYQEGIFHHSKAERHEEFFKSFIEVILDNLLSNSTKHFFINRGFLGYQAQEKNDQWIDSSTSNQQKISRLKNKISEKFKEKESPNHLAFMANLCNTNPTNWFGSKDAAAYSVEIASKLMDRLKSLFAIPAETSLSTTIRIPLEIVKGENQTHMQYLNEISPKNWLARERIDAKFVSILQDSLEKSLCIQFYGTSGCGKSAALCKLYLILNERNDSKDIVIARFVGLTDSSIFANELFRNLFLQVYIMAEENPQRMLGCFFLTDILKEAQNLLEKLPGQLYILIDDSHLLRFGRVLSQLNKANKKLLSKLSIILFSNSSNPLNTNFPKAEMFELNPMNLEQILEILKGESSQKISQKLGTDQLAILRNHLQKAKNNLIMAQIQCAELLNGELLLSVDIENFFNSIEQRCGVENVTLVAQLICCAPFGITRLELLDGFRLRKRNSATSFEPDDVLSVAPFHVLTNISCLLTNIYVDHRRLYIFKHSSITHIVRQRYLQSAGEIKLINEILANLLTYPSENEDEHEEAAASLIFPQPIYYENGSVNLRRVRFQWYYLLYTGNVENLKRLTLCSFEYLEATFRGLGLAHLLSIFEECLQQILDHDLLVIFEQVLLPAIKTLIRDERQFVSEFLNRLRYTRARNSRHLNAFVEQAMHWTDNYSEGPLLVPLTCWISPPKLKQVLSFTIPQWKSIKTIIQPTFNHQHLLVAGNDSIPGSIHMYHIASQILVKTFIGHNSRVSSLCTSNDAQFFTSTAFDGTIKIWNFAQNDCIKTLCVSTSKILCSLLGANDKWLVTGSADSTARVINIETGKVLRTFRDHTGPVVGVQLSSDDEFLITGSGDFVVMVWDIEQSAIILKMSGLMAPVTCLAITSNNAFLAVACEDETLRVFSTVSSQELHELSGHDSRVNALVASRDDCQLFVATKGRVLVYDIHNGQLLEVLQCDSQLPVTSLKITADNSFVLAACGERIHMWNMNSIEREMLHNDKSTLSYVRIAHDEKGAGCGTVDGILAFWDLDVCQCFWTSTQQKSSVTAIEFTNDSLIMISGSAAGSLSIWEISTGNFIKQNQMHRAEVTQISCFANGNRVLSCDKDSNVQIWNLFLNEDPIQMDLLVVLGNVQTSLYIRINDSVLIGQNASNPREVNIWSINLENQLTIKSKAYHNQEILCYCVNRSGNSLITGSKDESLKVWQSETGFLKQVLVGHKGDVVCCCVSECGKVVASGGIDQNLIVWDVGTGNISQSIPTFEVVNCVEISLDASVIVSSGESGWIEARNRENGQLLSSFNTHRELKRLIVSTDGNRILCQLSYTAQLPILCLHNTPASLVSSLKHSNSNRSATNNGQNSRLQRLQSATSFTSNFIGDEPSGINKITNLNSLNTSENEESSKTKNSSSKKSKKSSTKEDTLAENSKISNNATQNSVKPKANGTQNRKSNICLII